ncbi:MAG TPA: hypothetical protein VN228_05130 [Pyrinomonadaceae bacterium]|nr:hypothetical protein [Pyrinomonadaceae bacterium]
MRKFSDHPGRGALGAALAVALASCALFAPGGASAQSGRRRPAQQTQQPAQAEPQGESESGPKRSEAKPAAAVQLIVMEQDDSAFGVDSVTRGDVMESFAGRLSRSPSVALTRAGRGGRGEANKRAKGEEHAHVVLVALEEDFGDPARRTRQTDHRSLVIRTYVYAPKTGSLKFSDTVFQRAARPSVGVGGVRLPVPTRTIGRYPSQLELRQAAQDAADRLLSRFQIAPPADIP